MIQTPLTLLSSQGGCAAKIGPDELQKILGGLHLLDSLARSVVDTYEDAGFLKIDDRIQLAQSIDVITPVSDEPSILGAIATAHALGDLYAKGARPLAGLLLLGLPSSQVSTHTATKILQGAIDKLSQAEASMLGGHTMSSKELQVGLSVTGVIEGNPITNTGCQEGDVLILTKPLGSGIIVTGLKLSNAGLTLQDFSMETVENCQKIMLELNAISSKVMVEVGVHSCTDVSGFGLVGHLMEMLSKNRLSAELTATAIPVMPGAITLARQDVVPAGCEHNAAFWWDNCEFSVSSISHAQKMLLFDPQTSGGLLISVPASRGQTLLDRLRKAGVNGSSIIGQIIPRRDTPIFLKA